MQGPATDYGRVMAITEILFGQCYIQNIFGLKGGYPIIFALNVFRNSHLIQKCIQNQQLLLILYTLLNQMRVVKNIRRKDDRMNSLQCMFDQCIFSVKNDSLYNLSTKGFKRIEQHQIATIEPECPQYCTILLQGQWKLLEFGWASTTVQVNKRVNQSVVSGKYQLSKCPPCPILPYPAPPASTGPVLLSECELKLNSCGTHYVTDSQRQLQMTAVVCFKVMSHLLKFLFDD